MHIAEVISIYSSLANIQIIHKRASVTHTSWDYAKFSEGAIRIKDQESLMAKS